ncbi:MAG: hypothetical protein JNK78_11305, partial [Planctomycetes bacterium]|nr:hypothetical protein [Planctomycetota bacterium]
FARCSEAAIVGPDVVGVTSLDCVPVGTVVREKVAVKVRRPITIGCRLVDAVGAAVDWTGTWVSLHGWSEPVDVSGRATTQGKTRHLVMPGTLFQYRVRHWSDWCGSGQLRAPDPPVELDLPCQDVVGVGATVAAAQDERPITLRYDARSGMSESRELHVSPTGRISFSVGRREVMGPLVFERGAQSCSVVMPATEGSSIDLGFLSFDAVPYARVEVVDEHGKAVDDFVFVLRRPSGELVSSMTVPEGNGLYRIVGQVDEAWLELEGVASARGVRDVRCRVERGGVTRIALPSSVRGRFRVVLPPDAGKCAVAMRLTARLEPAVGQWVGRTDWALAAPSSSGAVADFGRLRPGRYRCDVVSLLPPVRLANAELTLGDANDAAADASAARQVTLTLHLPVGIPACWIAAASRMAGAGPAAMCEVDGGEQELLLPAGEEFVWLFGDSLVPEKVDVRGRVVVAAPVRPVTPDGLPGIHLPHTVLDPIDGTVFAAGFEQYRIAGSRVVVEPVSLANWVRANPRARLPCDYRVRVGDRPSVARFGGAGWTLDATVLVDEPPAKK